jgi:hypothetical protein
VVVNAGRKDSFICNCRCQSNVGDRRAGYGRSYAVWSTLTEIVRGPVTDPCAIDPPIPSRYVVTTDWV